MKFEVTLKQLRENEACVSGYNKIVSALKGIEFDSERETYIRFKHDEPISLISILDSNGIYDSLWCLRCNREWDRDSRLFAVWCARQVQHLITDERSLNALNVAENFANGNATSEELAAAWAAARDAARDAVCAAAWDAARGAAWDAAWDAQKEMFIKMCNGEAPWQVKKG